MRGLNKLRQFGVGEDTVVGINFQADPQNHRGSGLQGLWHETSSTQTHLDRFFQFVSSILRLFVLFCFDFQWFYFCWLLLNRDLWLLEEYPTMCHTFWSRFKLSTWDTCSWILLYLLRQGVRDLLKAVLDKIQTIPTTVSSAIVQQLLAAREVPIFIPLKWIICHFWWFIWILFRFTYIYACCRW